MKRYVLILVLTATALAGFGSEALGICYAIAPTVSCVPAACPLEEQTGFRIDWVNQSGCGCDRIEVWADEYCDGSYVLVATLYNCSLTTYTYCGWADHSYRFKIVYKNGTQQTVADIVTDCITCP